MVVKMRRFLFPESQDSNSRAHAALLFLRAVAGTAYMHHGWSKIQNPFGWMGPEATMPAFLQSLAAVSEFVGGLFWILGFLTPIASLGIFCTMVVAIYTHAIVRGDPFVGRGGSYELALVYAAVAVLLMMIGPGKYSIDGWIRRRARAATSMEGAPAS
jgi:putative oxidoreductase